MPLGVELDEALQYVPPDEMLNTPFIKEALAKEDKAMRRGGHVFLYINVFTFLGC